MRNITRCPFGELSTVFLTIKSLQLMKKMLRTKRAGTMAAKSLWLQVMLLLLFYFSAIAQQGIQDKTRADQGNLVSGAAKGTNKRMLADNETGPDIFVYPCKEAVFQFPVSPVLISVGMIVSVQSFPGKSSRGHSAFI